MKMHSALSASLAEEVPVALVFNGISHAVMMATPLHLEDFALGFALSEGLIDLAAQMYGVEVIAHSQGMELQIEIAAQCEARLKERKRSMAGRTGCGLCGTDSLDQIKIAAASSPRGECGCASHATRTRRTASAATFEAANRRDACRRLV